MPKLMNLAWCAALACLFTATLPAQAGDPPPNWRGVGAGTTAPVGGVHVDAFAGRSTHLSQFTWAGFHVLDTTTFTFVGEGTWTTPDGSTLTAEFTGQLFPSGDPDYPYGFVAELWTVGGTGCLAGATGTATMIGAFSGVPGDVYYEFEGTLRVGGP